MLDSDYYENGKKYVIVNFRFCSGWFSFKRIWLHVGVKLLLLKDWPDLNWSDYTPTDSNEENPFLYFIFFYGFSLRTGTFPVRRND